MGAQQASNCHHGYDGELLAKQYLYYIACSAGFQPVFLYLADKKGFALSIREGPLQGKPFGLPLPPGRRQGRYIFLRAARFADAHLRGKKHILRPPEGAASRRLAEGVPSVCKAVKRSLTPSHPQKSIPREQAFALPYQKGNVIPMKEQYNVGIIGATGMVGQRFITLLENHPWFHVALVAASPRSAGKPYAQAVGSRWAMKTPIPQAVADLTVYDAVADKEKIASQVDFVFCAVDMKKDEIKALEEAYAKLECPVISNNSAGRGMDDVPMVVPELNADHIAVIEAQRKRLGTKRGFIAVKSNCSLQSYVPALHPLREFGLKNVLACTYQAISGAGKTFETFPEIADNVIPFIGGEEEKSELEPMKIWGTVENGRIVNASSPSITTQCLRIPVSDGHMAAVFVSFDRKPTKEEILARWAAFSGPAQELGLPSAPKQFLHYFEEENRPQTRLDRDTENGMAVCIGRLREDSQYDYKFVCLSHNTLRGAAGGGVLMAELLAKKDYL